MKLSGKSAKQPDIDIADFYAIKIRSIWNWLKQEEAPFWWLCIYLFFEYVRPQAIYPVINVLPWGQVTLLIACVTAITYRNIKYVNNPANVLFISFFIIIILSSIFAFDSRLAFKKIDSPVNWLILYFLVITVVNNEKKYFVFMLLYFLVNFKMSQFGYLSYAKRGFGYAGWGLTGSPGWFKNAADFGVQMTIFAPLVAAFILAMRKSWGRYKRLFFYLMPFTAVVTIIGTASRGAQLGFLATGIWFLLKNRKGLKALAGIVVIGLAFYSFLPERMLEEYNQAGHDRTSENRLILWEFGLEVVRDYPLLGVGYENWRNFCWYMKPNGLGEHTRCQVLHNTYLEGACEIGIAGFVLFILMLIYMFVQNARTRTNAEQLDNRFMWYIAHGLDGGLIGCMVASMFISILFYPIFWVQLAMTVALYEISKKQLANPKQLPHKRQA